MQVRFHGCHFMFSQCVLIFSFLVRADLIGTHCVAHILQGLILERAASFDDKILNLLEYDYISSRMIGYFVHPSLCFISLPS
ncbi:hypothetical protein Csa_008244 [Cucumis sativus]|nr:hypothetical protein Csa_008244 [Cucumis sativus]